MELFASKIRQLREYKGIYQRQLAAALSIDTPMYCRIERGERRAKREQIPVIAEILQTDPEELLALWLADQVTAVVADETNIAKRVLKIADKSLNKNMKVKQF
jgi:transcriptional regulator with XRE-family HTH domain